MEFKPKDFESTYMTQIKDQGDLLDVTSKYFFCYCGKFVYIKKGRSSYKLICSPNINLKPLYMETIMNVIFENKDLSKVIHSFRSVVNHVLEEIVL